MRSKEAINVKIERGLTELDRGEGIPGDQLRARLAAAKAAWINEKDRSSSRNLPQL
jgi:hypothetical protein